MVFNHHRDKIARQSGFTLFELMVVVLIIGLLSAVVTANFRQMRISQEMNASARDLVSSIREVQNNILTGKYVTSSQSARAYALVFTQNSTAYSPLYNLLDVNGNNTTSTLSVISLKQNSKIQQILVGGNPVGSAELRLEAPFGRFSVNGTTSQLQINLVHTTGERSRSVIVNPISGRVEDQ